MMEFEVTRISYAIEIDGEKFLDLLDSESYVTGDAAYQPGAGTLCEKLGRDTAAQNIEYNGHFGAAIYLSLDIDDNTEETKASILKVIGEHLDWCSLQPKRSDVIDRRGSSTPC